MEQQQQQEQLKQITSIRQKHPPAVPFLWEQCPGIPKHHWKPDTTAIPPPPPPLPIKLIASVPFEWEELPGKPLSCFSHPPQPELIIHEQQILSVLAPTKTSNYSSEDIVPLLSVSEDDDYNGNYYGILHESVVEPETAQVASYDINGSTVPNPILMNWNSSPPSSPESESEDGNYAGGASLVGVSFLERLFPLLLRQNADCPDSENIGTTSNAKPQEEEEEEEKVSVAVRRAHTLGELIMMSRRISRKRKAIQIQKQGFSIMDQVLEEKSDMICMGGCMTGVIDKVIMKNKTHFHQLKFM